MSGFAGLFTFPDPPPDAGWIVLFDGAIYNRAALRAELAAAGTPPPVSGRDGDLIRALYAQHGAACVERLRGPFALAMWDPENDVGLLARDASGLRTLYYFHDEPGGRLVFATGVRPMAEGGTIPVRLDARGLYGFFRHGAPPEPFTIVAGIHALETGGWLLWRAGHITRDRFRPPPRPAISRVVPARTLRAALLDSVDAHLADNPAAGVFVGGGVGSAALLALARETGHAKNLRALTLGFDDPALDESDAARRVAEHFGVPHTPLRLDRERARAWFDDYLAALDQPGVHGFPLFALCRFAREEGLTVSLAGLGLGEMYGDSAFHSQLLRLMKWGHRRGSPRTWIEQRFLGATTCPSPRRLADFLSRPPALAGAYAAVRGIHTAGEARAIVARFADPTGCADPLSDDLAARDFPTANDGINALEWRRRLRDQLLRDAAALAGAHALELRLPFVDERVSETLAPIPADTRAWVYPGAVLEAVPEIAPWIPGKKRASGLQFPYETWRAAEWGASKPADAVNRPMRRTWEQRWSLFLFRRWWRQFAKR